MKAECGLGRDSFSSMQARSYNLDEMTIMARNPAPLSEHDYIDLEGETLLSPSQREEVAEEAPAAHAQLCREKKWKKWLKSFSLALVVVSLMLYAFFVGILVGNHWKNRVLDIMCLERTSRPCMLLIQQSK